MKNEIRLADIPLPDTTSVERQVLADIIHTPEVLPDVEGFVRKEFFTDPSRAKIYDIIISMFNAGENIDLPSVYAKAGKEVLQEVITPNPDPSTPSAAYSHAKLLRDSAIRRRAYLSAVQFIQSCADGEKAEEDIYAGVQQMAQEIEGAFPVFSETKVASVINEIAEDIQQRAMLKQKGLSERITTGFRTLDWITYQGWGPGQLIILAARPSVGKTAVSLQMAKAAALSGTPVMMFSLEMTKKELVQRLLYSTGLVEPGGVMSGNVDWPLFEDASGKLSPLPFYINDESRSLPEIISKMVIAHQRGKCGIALIDYLGLIQTSSNLPLYQAIAQITGDLKATAKKLKIPIVLLCQLNRLMVKENRAPELFDLRDSGSIEQDADIVIMLEQQPGFEESTPNLNMWVRKNRQYKKDICITVRPNETYSAFYELQNNQ